MDNFTFMDGVVVSLFSITVVFVVLITLAIILELFSKLIVKFESKVEVEETTPVPLSVNDDEELLVAKIIVGCLIQESGQSNVRIKSIKRVEA